MEGVEKLSILTKPFAGWTILRIGEKTFATFSYLDDVPLILGHALLDALNAVRTNIHQEIPFLVSFDCEGHDVVLSNLFGHVCITDSAEWADGAYVSHEVFGPKVEICEALVYMAYALANDIQNHLDAWVRWDASLPDPNEEAALYAQEVTARTQMLKSLTAALRTDAEITEEKLKSCFAADYFSLI